MVELLVVIGIIVVLFGAIFTASSTLINKARTANTLAVLVIVRDAVEQFQREQEAEPTLTKSKAYHKRYGRFPPDELEVFTSEGIPPKGTDLMRGRLTIAPAPPYDTMKFYTRGMPANEAAKEHRDLAAMIVAIEEFGDNSKVLLDGIPDRNRVSGPLDDTGDPAQFIDRNRNGSWEPEEDAEILYIVDNWGVPISYMAQRDWDPDDTPATVSSNHEGWNEGSTELIRLNGGQPVIFSYGPSGKDQLTSEMIVTPEPSGDCAKMDAPASLIGDFECNHKVDHPLNADNVYVNQALQAKLSEGLEE